MKVSKIFSLIFALTLCANQAFCDDSAVVAHGSKIKYPVMWKFTESTPKHIENQKILVKYVVDFDARGGEYAIINTTTGEYIDRAQIFSKQYYPYNFGNISRLFAYAAGLHSGAIKADEIAFNQENTEKFDRVSKEAIDELLKILGIREYNSAEEMLYAYTTLMKNEDNYLTESQLEVLKTAMLQNVEKGKAKQAKVEGANVSGLGATNKKNKNPNLALSVFIGEFEKDGQNYAILTILDEPKPRKSTYGFNSAGWNAVPMARDLIENMTKEKDKTPSAVLNKKLLERAINNYSANGGAYMIVDMETREIIEKEFIDFDEDYIFSSSSFYMLYLNTVGLNTGVLNENNIWFDDTPLDFASWFKLQDRKRVLKELDLPFNYHFRYPLYDHLKTYMNVISNKNKLLTDSQQEALRNEFSRDEIIGNDQKIKFYGLISQTVKKYEKKNTINMFIGSFVVDGKEYGLAVLLDSPQGIRGEDKSYKGRYNVLPMAEEIIENFVGI